MEECPNILGEKIGNETFIDTILKPHRCYYKALNDLFEQPHIIHGLAHITGGGICENLNRILPLGLDAKLNLSAYKILDIFKVLKTYGKISDSEMLRTFNLGVGMALVTSKDNVEEIVSHIERQGVKCNIIGEIIKGKQEVVCEGKLVW